MKYYNKVCVVFILLLLATSCQYIESFQSNLADDIVLKIGEYELTEDAIPSFEGLDENNQKRMRADFIEKWKRETILAYYADKEIGNDPYIEEKIREIKGQVLSAEFLELYMKANSVEEISEEEIQFEFDSNLVDYVPVPILYKLRYIITDQEVPENNEITSLLGNPESENFYNLELFSIKNAFAYDLSGDTWKSAFELAEVLPAKFFEIPTYRIGRPFILEEKGFHAYIIVDDYSESMNNPPFDYLKPIIKERLKQKKNKVIMESFYNSLLKRGNSEGVIQESPNK